MKCVHSTKDDPEGCWKHPEPDPVGRYRCSVCGCFTAAPDRVHGWCLRGGMGRWLASFSLDTEGPR